jgi:integrase
MGSRRDVGSIRQLPSGRWQVRSRAVDGRLTPAPVTFPVKSAAVTWLALLQADQARGAWFDPAHGQTVFSEFAGSWLACRPGLRPRTLELYRGLLDHHLVPVLGGIPVNRITPGLVRRWHAERLRSGAPGSTTAKAYRLLSTILATAVADEVIVRSPCVLGGAGVERPAERVPPTLEQAEALADAVDPRWRMLVLMAAWSGLRWGELVALTRRRINPLHATVTVVEQFVELVDRVETGPPKTAAGRRTVHLPPHLLPALYLRLRVTWSDGRHLGPTRCCSPVLAVLT